MAYTFLERAYMKAATAIFSRAMPVAHARDQYRLFRAEVTRVRDVAPKMRRLTLAAPELTTFERLGLDEYFGLVMAPAGQPLQMPTGTKLNIRAELADMPEASRPELRWYTVRELRRELGEVDVDIVIHDAGPGGAFLARVQPGEIVGFREGSATYQLPAPGERHLLVADETALPALGSISDAARAGAGDIGEVVALVEIPDRDYLLELDAPFDVHVLERGAAAPGELVLPSLADSDFDLDRLDFAWACGEQALATGTRRHLVKHCGMDRRSVMFSGYWRIGAARV